MFYSGGPNVLQDNDLVMAKDLINQIRNRAKGSQFVMGLCTTYKFDGSAVVVDCTKSAAHYKVEPYTVFSSKEEAKKAVQMEWTLEFANEGQRFFNLRIGLTLKMF